MWGNPEPRKTILVDGLAFPVGPNLYHALMKLRSSLEVKTMRYRVWIDAICIEQNNLLEVDQQIKMMGSIYENATKVVVWLGPYPSYQQQAGVGSSSLDISTDVSAMK